MSNARHNHIISIFRTIILLYIGSVAIMACFYWWKDVKLHNSFVKSIAWSPIAGVFKATHWPYYVFIQKNRFLTHANGLNENQMQSVQAFFAANEYLQDIQKLAKVMATAKDPRADLDHVKSLIKKALERLNECDAIVLNNIYPGWGDIVIDKFIPALQKLDSGIKPGGDRNDLARSDALFADFDTWIYANWNKIGEKVGE